MTFFNRKRWTISRKDRESLMLNGQPIEIEIGSSAEKSRQDVLAEIEGSCEQIDTENESYKTCFEADQSVSFADRLKEIADEGKSHRPRRNPISLCAFQRRWFPRFFMSLKSGTGFNIQEFMPGDNDVPGPEHSDLPRPPDSVRVLSSYEEGHPYLVSMLLSPASSKEELIRWYRENMSTETWIEIQPEDAQTDNSTLWFRRTGAITRFITIHFDPPQNEEEEQDGTMIVITEAQ